VVRRAVTHSESATQVTVDRHIGDHSGQKKGGTSKESRRYVLPGGKREDTQATGQGRQWHPRGDRVYSKLSPAGRFSV